MRVIHSDVMSNIHVAFECIMSMVLLMFVFHSFKR